MSEYIMSESDSLKKLFTNINSSVNTDIDTLVVKQSELGYSIDQCDTLK